MPAQVAAWQGVLAHHCACWSILVAELNMCAPRRFPAFQRMQPHLARAANPEEGAAEEALAAASAAAAAEDVVFMRWKEKSFETKYGEGCGLTIAVRRSQQLSAVLPTNGDVWTRFTLTGSSNPRSTSWNLQCRTTCCTTDRLHIWKGSFARCWVWS